MVYSPLAGSRLIAIANGFEDIQLSSSVRRIHEAHFNIANYRS
jgi:hypothetical protein